MASKFLVEKRALSLAILLGVLCLVIGIAYAQVQGHLTLGQSGSVSGALTLMPPDGTGWYHIDNPGNQMLRISGGGRPGQYLYVTISHPGKVTVHGDLEVTGTLLTKRGPSASFQGSGKADTATPGDVQTLQRQVDQLNGRVNELASRVNALTK
jgi:hypothetical protein